jgi:hypothetical protein
LEKSKKCIEEKEEQLENLNKATSKLTKKIYIFLIYLLTGICDKSKFVELAKYILKGYGKHDDLIDLCLPSSELPNSEKLVCYCGFSNHLFFKFFFYFLG